MADRKKDGIRVTHVESVKSEDVERKPEGALSRHLWDMIKAITEAGTVPESVGYVIVAVNFNPGSDHIAVTANFPMADAVPYLRVAMEGAERAAGGETAAAPPASLLDSFEFPDEDDPQ